nr:TetR/AcrR family transcriptional regulator [uncultured Tolumonas sp.]
MRVKSEARRQAIVDVAKEVFSRQGFENTSMSEIASRVGGSKATLYNYFSSKEEIFAAVMESSATEQIAGAFKLLEEENDIRSTLLNFGLHYLRSILAPDIMAIRKMAINEADRSDIGRHFYENGPKKGWLLVSNYLQQQIEQQRLITCDAGICAMYLKALIEAEVVEPYALGVLTEVDEQLLIAVVERAITVFLKAYQA